MPQLPMDGNLKHIYVPKIDILFNNGQLPTLFGIL